MRRTYREKVAIAPMLMVANIKKILYPSALTRSGVTFERQKSTEHTRWGQSSLDETEESRDALKSH